MEAGALSQPTRVNPPRERSQEPIDSQFTPFSDRFDDRKSYAKSAQLSLQNSNEKPELRDQRASYRYNGRGQEPEGQQSNLEAYSRGPGTQENNRGQAEANVNVSNFTNIHDSRDIFQHNMAPNSTINNRNGADNSYSYSRMQGNDTYEWLNVT